MMTVIPELIKIATCHKDASMRQRLFDLSSFHPSEKLSSSIPTFPIFHKEPFGKSKKNNILEAIPKKELIHNIAGTLTPCIAATKFINVMIKAPISKNITNKPKNNAENVE